MKSTYILKGDGPLVFMCYDQTQTLKVGIDNVHYLNAHVLAHRMPTSGHTPQQWKQYVCKCAQPGQS